MGYSFFPNFHRRVHTWLSGHYGTNSVYSWGTKFALFVEISITMFDYFRYVLLRFVTVSFLSDNIMRNRTQSLTFISMLILYEVTVLTYLRYFRNDFDIRQENVIRLSVFDSWQESAYFCYSFWRRQEIGIRLSVFDSQQELASDFCIAK